MVFGSFLVTNGSFEDSSYQIVPSIHLMTANQSSRSMMQSQLIYHWEFQSQGTIQVILIIDLFWASHCGLKKRHMVLEEMEYKDSFHKIDFQIHLQSQNFNSRNHLQN